ncbi:CoA-binding protein [Roseomonas sp. SSH11]|uniref:CoA-binding protein n=1 Tax=Pararoseomonas baculiformis TaxID=2820812 RepID=A0ABS4ACZ4_9PROT|nr:CoA-binding protein [Pararoseomonas baculiformis]MBP0444114.1 CoA-binding protein [Pararoseomonas baculiformis]
MPRDGLSDDAVRDLLLRTRRIAVVGASDKPSRPSHGVFGFLLARGYMALPVNPALDGRSVHGMQAVPSLEEAGPLDMVDVFRRSEEAGPVVDEAIRLGAKSVWLQLGIWDDAAAERARAAGVTIVMDRCPVIEWSRLGLPGRIPAGAAH